MGHKFSFKDIQEYGVEMTKIIKNNLFEIQIDGVKKGSKRFKEINGIIGNILTEHKFEENFIKIYTEALLFGIELEETHAYKDFVKKLEQHATWKH